MTREYFNNLSSGNFLENFEKGIKNDGLIHSEHFFEKYNEGISNISTHDVINQLILNLHKDYELVICSSMESKYIIQKLEKENIRHCFSEILGMDVHRSKVVKIKSILAKNTFDPSNIVFITDTTGDVLEGRECSVASIAVTWGNHNRDRLLSVQPYAVVDTVPELEQAIEQFFTH
jgi:phosphoglycolate phosphatase